MTKEQKIRSRGLAGKWLWLLGAGSFVFGSIVNFFSMSFAPQSLLSSLGSVQFISNVFFGKLILHEIVTTRIIIGTTLIMLGNLLTILFSPHGSKNFSKEDLVAYYDAQYKLLLLIEGSIALTMHLTYERYKGQKEKGRVMKGADTVMPMCFAICSAIIGTQSAVQGKCLSELINLSVQGDNQMQYPFTYLVLIIWVCSTGFWIVRMNKALSLFHGLFIIPALQVFWTFFSVLGGGIYFKEFQELTPERMCAFALGVGIVFVGVYQLAPRTQLETKLDEPPTPPIECFEISDVDLGRENEFGERYQLSRRSTMDGQLLVDGMELEAGDEEIDWKHTRMVSLGFFPSITTDEDMAPILGLSPKLLRDNLGPMCDQPRTAFPPSSEMKGMRRRLSTS
ncbi:unnamed protein product [Chrysoparadoxa australica]